MPKAQASDGVQGGFDHSQPLRSAGDLPDLTSKGSLCLLSNLRNSARFGTSFLRRHFRKTACFERHSLASSELANNTSNLLLAPSCAVTRAAYF